MFMERVLDREILVKDECVSVSIRAHLRTTFIGSHILYTNVIQRYLFVVGKKYKMLFIKGFMITMSEQSYLHAASTRDKH